MDAPLQTRYDRQIASWLIICAAVLFGMIVLGGVTRLTGSGLSMVEWKPLMGIVPPLTEQAWQETFAKYQLYPEYQQVNRDMNLSGFKQIFMFEYLHRLLGRLIGVLFFLPMLFFALKGRVRSGLMPKLWLLFCLGGLQGLLGWYMVKSGLVDNPRVSQYRLTAHLGLAVAIYGYMLWLVFDLLFASVRRSSPNAGRGGALLLVALVFLMILSGGLVAGTRAGLIYPTWPLMGEGFFPAGLYSMSPVWLSIFEDLTTIQFNHRMFAYLLVLLLGSFAWRLWRVVNTNRARMAAATVVVALLIQVGLGISTLVLHVPVPLAAAHQGGAILLFTAVLFASHLLRKQ